MTDQSDPAHSSTFLKIKAASDGRRDSDVLRIMQELGISSRRVSASGKKEFVIQVPFDRVQEAMLILELHGFRNVRAYGVDVGTGGVEGV